MQNVFNFDVVAINCLFEWLSSLSLSLFFVFSSVVLASLLLEERFTRLYILSLRSLQLFWDLLEHCSQFWDYSRSQCYNIPASWMEPGRVSYWGQSCSSVHLDGYVVSICIKDTVKLASKREDSIKTCSRVDTCRVSYLLPVTYWYSLDNVLFHFPLMPSCNLSLVVCLSMKLFLCWLFKLY